MAEASTPLAVHSSVAETAPDLLRERVRQAPDHVAFGRRTASGWKDVTTAQFAAECRDVARGLIAQGVGVGDRVAVMAPTRYEWAVVDFAIWLAGGVVVPLYETASVRQVGAIVAETAPVLAIAESDAHVATLASAAGSVPVWTMDAGVRDLAALAASGRGVPDGELDARASALAGETVATIVYTSGTTARQKGVVLTHANLVSEVLNVAHDYAELINDRAVTIVILPLAHILARGLQLVAVAAGMKVVHEPDRTRALATFAEVRPTFLVVVPQLLTRIRAAARAKAAESRLDRVWRAAEATAVEWSHHLEALQDDPRRRPPRLLAVRRAFFDRLFYARLRRQLGGRVDWLLSGAAPLDEGLARFFWGAGVPVIQGYGLTETTAPATGQRPGDVRPGGVGTPIPGTVVRIADDGEVLLKGAGVFGGYLNDADNADAFVDGFFRTGDLGSLDAAGRLTLHGRRKNLIVTASGKNVAPEPWEDAVAKSPLVAHALLIGEGRSHLTALLLLDPDAVRAWASEHRLGEVMALLDAAAPSRVSPIEHASLRARLDQSVARANAAVSRAEQVKDYRMLLADIGPTSPVLTPTLKLRRDALLDAASGIIDDLYRP